MSKVNKTYNFRSMSLVNNSYKIITKFVLQNTKYNTAVKLTVVPCPPVVEVKIRRPDTKYQLGFSVQNGVVSIPTIYIKLILKMKCLLFM